MGCWALVRRRARALALISLLLCLGWLGVNYRPRPDVCGEPAAQQLRLLCSHFLTHCCPQAATAATPRLGTRDGGSSCSP